MTNELTPEIRERMAALLNRYRQTLLERVTQAEAAWQKVDAQQQPQESLLELVRLIHGLSGSGTLYGYAKLSQESRDLELLLRPLVETQTLPDTPLRQRIQDAMARVKLASAAPDAPTSFDA